MTRVGIEPSESSDCNWLYNGYLCGDGPIQEYPRGSVCQIAPVHDPENEKDHVKYHPAIEIDLEELIAQLGPTYRIYRLNQKDLEDPHGESIVIVGGAITAQSAKNRSRSSSFSGAGW